MHHLSTLKHLLVAVACFLSSGCVGNRQYWKNDFVKPPGVKPGLAVIESDDQGNFWDERQLLETIKQLESLEKNTVVITYFHGWKHNARPIDEDLIELQRFSNGLAKIMGESHHVFPIYLGWRGNTVNFRRSSPITWPLWPFQQLTFWSRKRAANRVAGTASTEALFSILQSARANPLLKNKVIFVGHSFGALVMERALTQPMVGSLLQPQLAESKIAAAARPLTVRPDLVLLINSAAESFYASQFISMLKRNPSPDGKDASTPLVISVTSEGDRATGCLFPLGTRIASVFKSYREGQRYYFTHTPGHNDHLQSHIVTNAPAQTMALSSKTTEDEIYEIPTEFLSNLADAPNSRFFQAPSGNYVIENIPDAVNQTPYWIIRVPKEIINDHGDIFNTNFVAMTGTLFRLSRSVPTEVETVKQRRNLLR